MEKSELAEQLRQRQIKAGLVEKHLVESLSDDEVIDSQTICRFCGKSWLVGEEQQKRIDWSKDAEHYLKFAESARKYHEDC